MPDREKVIQALETLHSIIAKDGSLWTEPTVEAIPAAIELLKADPEVKAVKTYGATGILWIDCSRCGGLLPKWAKYCPECGGKVKWDDP